MKTALTSTKFWLALGATVVFGLGVSVRAAGLPALAIIAPEANTTVSGSSVTTQLAVGNFTLADYQAHLKNVSGQGHIHLWLDQDAPTKTSAVKVTGLEYTFENVRPGNHVLVAELVNNDHSSLYPPVTAEVAFATQPLLTSPSSRVYSSLFMTSILAFILLVITLYFLNLQVKTKSHSGKLPKKSARSRSK